MIRFGFVFVMACLAACFPANQSNKFECSNSEDCNGGRVCDRGYCVEASQQVDANPCPQECTTCDVESQDCTIVCDNPNECAQAACPAGYNCVIQCIGNNTCDTVGCGNGASCEIVCNGQNTCGTINCGGAPCDVQCNGQSSCAQINCQSSCRCDVSCGSQASCISTCPLAPVSPQRCTESGMAGEPCDSSFDPACDSC